VEAWLESFRSTSELILDVVDEEGRTACLARNGIDGRDALVAGWPKSNWKEQEQWECRARTDMRLVPDPGTRLPLLWLMRGCNGLLTIWVFGVDNTELDKVSP
jgi:hypothetical protein